MIIAVFSLGQFISSKLDLLKLGFQEWFKTQKKEDVSGEIVWKWMADNLAPLRVGEITLKQFCDKFNEHFQVNMTFTEFSKIFNSMCTLDKASLDRVAKFKGFLEEHDGVKFVLVSHTNYSHLYYILSQLPKLIPETAVISDDKWSESEQILFAPSMSSKCTEHPDTLKYALKKLKIDKEDHVISFLNTIKAYDHPHFSYVDPGKDLEKVAETVESLQESKKTVVYSV
ncbi:MULTISPECIES: hypothetical protein [Legionella]|uniref:Uncharacterized protein n=1 Tax=Legionella resiliens TaxID=2905958 RepID=A0ABS8X4K6_9GAMM|nr:MULTISPECIES: hypothetical protein [unclassified Legionella]MCE0723742.1 hypothetical protein [Legionella sp. 9fVS26]MCE3532894.1 hypothetical protein [Legionella sp. 8cVS16]QLZ69082.1 hypothetical protein FOLKNPGA_01864 [Legionella sp. PC1000]